MVALRDLSWPHLVPIRRQSTASSTPRPLKKPVSAKNLIDQIQTAQQSRRRSSEGDCPANLPFQTGTGLQLSVPDSALTSRHLDGDLHSKIEEIIAKAPSTNMQTAVKSQGTSPEPPFLLPELSLGADVESMSGSTPNAVDISLLTDSTAKSTADARAESATDSYFFPPRLSEVPVENSDPQSHAHRPPISPTASTEAADSAADDSNGFPSSRLSFARFQFGSKASFNTSMAPLVPSRPDSPIGGLEAPPMRKQVSLGNRALSPKGFAAPLIEITSPTPRSACCEEGGVKALR